MECLVLRGVIGAASTHPSLCGYRDLPTGFSGMLFCSVINETEIQLIEDRICGALPLSVSYNLKVKLLVLSGWLGWFHATCLGLYWLRFST